MVESLPARSACDGFTRPPEARKPWARLADLKIAKQRLIYS
jgi:hypothetical protein